MKEWEQWISINKPKLIHVANFEERFVREILARIPEITPNDVTAQYHFQFPNGSNGYIDFCIKNDSKGYFVSIELDGAWKANAPDFAALLERQNVMMASRIGSLLRFANSTWLGKSDQTIQTIRKVLEEQHKGFNDKVRSEDLVRQLKNMQDELLRLKQQNSNNETAQLTALVGNLSKQLHEQKAVNNTQDINTVMLGLAQQIKDMNQVPPVQSKQYVPLYIGIGLAVLGVGFGVYSSFNKDTQPAATSVNSTLQGNTTTASTTPNSVTIDKVQPAATSVNSTLQRNTTTASTTPNSVTIDKVQPAATSVNSTLLQRNTTIASTTPNSVTTDKVQPAAGYDESNAIQSHEAINHIGETRVVCGYVAQIKEIGGRTYINLGSSYPRQDMTFVIWPDDAYKVSNVLDSVGKTLCVKGNITVYKDIPQIALKDPTQIVN